MKIDIKKYDVILDENGIHAWVLEVYENSVYVVFPSRDAENISEYNLKNYTKIDKSPIIKENNIDQIVDKIVFQDLQKRVAEHTTEIKKLKKQNESLLKKINDKTNAESIIKCMYDMLQSYKLLSDEE